MARSQRRPAASRAGCVRAAEGEHKTERSVTEMKRDVQLPMCRATSLHAHQKQIRRRSKWPWEMVSRNSRGQSHDLSRSRDGCGRRAFQPTHIYIVENSICPFGSSNCFRFARHQSNLFVCAHQDVTPGLHSVIPIQFAPSVPRVLTVAAHKVALLWGWEALMAK